MGLLDFLFGKRIGGRNDRKKTDPSHKNQDSSKKTTISIDVNPILAAVEHLAERCEDTSAAGRTEWLMLLCNFYVANLHRGKKTPKTALRELYSASRDARHSIPTEADFIKLYRAKSATYRRELSDLGFVPGASPLPDAKPVHSFVGVYIEPLKPDLRYVGIRAKNMEPQLKAYTQQLRAFLTEFSASIE